MYADIEWIERPQVIHESQSPDFICADADRFGVGVLWNALYLFRYISPVATNADRDTPGLPKTSKALSKFSTVRLAQAHENERHT